MFCILLRYLFLISYPSPDIYFSSWSLLVNYPPQKKHKSPLIDTFSPLLTASHNDQKKTVLASSCSKHVCLLRLCQVDHDAISAGRTTTWLPLRHNKWQICPKKNLCVLAKRRNSEGFAQYWPVHWQAGVSLIEITASVHSGVIFNWITGKFTLHFNSSHLTNQRVSEVHIWFATGIRRGWVQTEAAGDWVPWVKGPPTARLLHPTLLL